MIGFSFSTKNPEKKSTLYLILLENKINKSNKKISFFVREFIVYDMQWTVNANGSF